MTNLSDIVAFTLNGRDVSAQELLRSLKTSRQLQFIQAGVIQALISEAAEREGLTVGNDELQAASDAFRQANGLHKAADTRAWLAQNNVSQDDLEERLERDIVTEKLKRHVTEGKAEQYFAENRLSFDTAVISHVVVEDEGMAGELHSQITEEDADFYALARRYSVDHTSKSGGGYLGQVDRKSLSPAVEAAVFGAAAGAVVGPVKTDMGYHVIKVEDLPPTELTDARRAAIENELFDAWLSQTRAKAKVDVKLLDSI